MRVVVEGREPALQHPQRERKALPLVHSQRFGLYGWRHFHLRRAGLVKFSSSELELAEKTGCGDLGFSGGRNDCRDCNWNRPGVLELGGVAELRTEIYTRWDDRPFGPRVYLLSGDLRLACYLLERQRRRRRTKVPGVFLRTQLSGWGCKR